MGPHLLLFVPIGPTLSIEGEAVVSKWWDEEINQDLSRMLGGAGYEAKRYVQVTHSEQMLTDTKITNLMCMCITEIRDRRRLRCRETEG